MQQFFILVFLVYSIGFHRKLVQEDAVDGITKRQATTLLYTIYLCLCLITVSRYGGRGYMSSADFYMYQMRIIFRITEYSSGLHSTIPNHEAYQYCLDSLPMLLALVALNIVHPGRIMPSKESDMPSRKERKKGVRSKWKSETNESYAMANESSSDA